MELAHKQSLDLGNTLLSHEEQLNKHPQAKGRLASIASTTLLLLVLSLGVRLFEIGSLAPLPDEILWRRRAHHLNNMVNDGKLLQATTHLRHPGIPPAIVLAIGERIGNKYNTLRGRQPTTTGYIDAISSMRIMNASVSALAPPTLFLFTVSVIGFGPALCGALVLALEPNVISLSRIVHLDGVYPLLVLITVLSFFYSVERRSLKLTLLSGVFWGLCISTKLTAVALIPIFLAFKVLRSFLVPKDGDRGERRWVTWGDLWAVIIGQLVLASLFTKLWIHKGKELGRYAVESTTADTVYSAGSWLHAHSAYTFASLIVFIGALWIAAKYRKAKVNSATFHASMGTATIAFLMFFEGRFPVVSENLVRFWGFTSSLAAEKHENWGLWQPPQWGYVEILGRKLPSVILYAYLIAFSVSVFALLYRNSIKEKRVLSLLILAAIAPIIWCVPLSITEKQTYRYAVPIFGLLCLAAGMGFWILINYLHYKIPIVSKGTFRTCAILGLGLYLMLINASLHPHYYLSFNALSGGIAEAKERKLKFHFPGHNEAIEFLLAQSIRRNNAKLRVRILGDVHNRFSETLKHLHPDKSKQLAFHRSFSPEEVDYLVVLGLFPEHLSLIEPFFKGSHDPIVFRYAHQNVELLRVYEFPYPSYDEPYTIEANKLLGHVGRTRRFSNTKLLSRHIRPADNILARTVEPIKDKKGFAAFTIPARISRGNFIADFNLAFPDKFKPSAPRSAVAKLFLGHCERLVYSDELSSSGFRNMPLPCEIHSSGRAKLSVYWFGKQPLLINQIALRRTTD